MEKIQQNSEIQNLMKFLDKSVTNYHAVQEVCTQLDEQGFVQLSEKELWRLSVIDDVKPIVDVKSNLRICQDL